jgi:hypothetical protein
MALVRVNLVALRLQTNPSMQHEFGQPVARRTRKRRRGVEPAADLRSVDAEQPDAPDRGDVDGVAVDDRAYEQGIRSA